MPERELENLLANSADVAARRRLTSEDERQSVSHHVDHLRREGFVIVHDLLSSTMLVEMREELDRIEATRSPMGGEFLGDRTLRTIGLVGITRAFDPLIEHPTILAIAEAYFDDQITLSQSSTVTILPGETRQAFHRDDECYPVARPHEPLLINCFAALDDFTAENGATRFYRRTHLTADTQTQGEPEIAEMPAGSALIMDGSLLHAGWDHNSTAKRRGVPILYNRGWLRGQENTFLAVPPDSLASVSPTMRRLLGYWTYGILLGNIDGGDPLQVMGLQK